MTKETNKHSHQTHKSHKKVFDVVPPGKAPASPTSRPVIMGHKPPVADDQFVSGTGAASDDSDHRPMLGVHKKAVIAAGDTPELGGQAGDSGSASSSSTGASANDGLVWGDATAGTPAQPDRVSDSSAGVASTTTGPNSNDSGISEVATSSVAGSLASVAAQEKTPSAPVLSSANFASGRGSAPNFLTEWDESDDATAGSDAPDAASNAASTSVGATASASDAGAGTPSQAETPSDRLADLAVDQVVDADLPQEGEPDDPRNGELDSAGSDSAAGGSAAPDISAAPSTSANAPATLPTSQSARSKTVDDLLAESGPPDLESQPRAIISTHRHKTAGWLEPILVFILILLIATLILDFLLDANLLKTTLNIPHTHLFN